MKTYARELTLFFTLLLACPVGHAAEQDNWYLANEWSVSGAQGVAYYEDNVTGIGQIYVANGSGSSAKISVYDLNGSLARNITIASARHSANDLVLDSNGTIYVTEDRCVTCLENDGTFKWRTGKNTSISSGGSSGSGNGEFSTATGIALAPNGNLYVADSSNRRIQVLDKNGTFIRTFGNSGEAPGEFNSLKSVAFLHDDTLVVTDQRRIHWFQPDGTFVKRLRENDNHWEGGYMATSKSGEIITFVTRLPNNHYVRDVYVFNSDGEVISRLTNDTSNTYESGWRYVFTADGDLIISTGSNIKLLKRAYRTKGLPVRNVIPQPAVRAITQRAGTNIIDLDFEIVDPDDANATVGILAAKDGAFSDTSKWILPQTWVDGTGSKIGTPIATNQVHRVSWNVKPDWPDSTGTLKFEIICHDARRTSPVDLHFITLPLPDGNLTISRSPLKDSDFLNYSKFLLATGQAQFESNVSKVVVIPKIEANATQIYTFTNAGATGKSGPTPAQLATEYNGTNLQGSVSTGFQPGYQKWTVPATGTYVIEAVGASGGSQPNKNPGFGAFVRGEFNLTVGQELTILVGQMGINNSTASSGAGGGGGTFVVTDSNDTPLIIAGGGSGASGDQHGSHASILTTGLTGSGSPSAGGANGSGGQGQYGGGGGGFLSSGTGSNNLEGKSFQLGGAGGDGATDGGFGGGGSNYSNSSGWDNSGGGGGYSGGGGSGSSSGHDSGGGGGSYNSGSNQLNASSSGGGHGYVRIFRAEGINPGRPKIILITPSLTGSQLPLLEALGNDFRFATAEEVQKAREAATPGSVNQWTANRPVQPRNLPNKVNEYGFDTGDHGNRAWWIVQE